MHPPIGNLTVERSRALPGLRLLLFSALLTVLGGCAPPKPKVSPPEVVTVPDYPEALPNGSIYQPHQGGVALFEDWGPGRVGDVITVRLDERVSASKSSRSNASRGGSASLNLDDMPRGAESLADYGFAASGDSDFSGSGGSEASNRFDGTITVTVREVLPNGNFLVSGEKQIAINQGTEYIRFSGIVHPRAVSRRNTVASSDVASARIEYLGDGYIAESQRMGWLQRFWLWVSPF